MPSPFPGMNPYLEQSDAWHGFHKSFCPTCCGALTPQLAPDYYATLRPHVYVHEPTAEERKRGGLVVDIERESFIEILRRESHQLVTVIELLSRPNKAPGADHDDYVQERRRTIEDGVNFVEIDLLRGGMRPPVENLPECDYYVMVARPAEWPRVGLWPLKLRDRLPKIPVPLRPGDHDAKLDLQALLDRIYDAAGYEDYIYHDAPEPPLTYDNAAWAAEVLASRGIAVDQLGE